jgi:hypothetical protein
VIEFNHEGTTDGTKGGVTSNNDTSRIIVDGDFFRDPAAVTANKWVGLNVPVTVNNSGYMKLNPGSEIHFTGSTPASTTWDLKVIGGTLEINEGAGLSVQTQLQFISGGALLAAKVSSSNYAWVTGDVYFHDSSIVWSSSTYFTLKFYDNLELDGTCTLSQRWDGSSGYGRLQVVGDFTYNVLEHIINVTGTGHPSGAELIWVEGTLNEGALYPSYPDGWSSSWVLSGGVRRLTVTF